MSYIKNFYNKIKKKKSFRYLPSIDAYSLWSTFYDNQPDNVVLHLENKLFSEMLSEINLTNKTILDIGCGTGRHWNELLEQKPSCLIGTDNSKEMLDKLRKKFPNAEVYISENNSLNNFEDSHFDFIISTLTIGHIKNIEKYFEEWNRVLKPNSKILITEFHPDAFRIGMKRTFLYENEIIEVENYLYSLDYLKKIFERIGWSIVLINEKIINEEVRHLFEKQNYLDEYNKYKGTLLILGMIMKKR